mmetsp:Transcript_85931/g.192114  ORF Transcript_85931/g.192114 Transcript_85931/m.192114 type:complete len:262 (-) Transcript_85931:297-1082(-)
MQLPTSSSSAADRRIRFCNRFHRCKATSSSCQYHALVNGDHVLDVDEGVLAPVHLEKLEGLVDEVPDVYSFALRVVDLIANIGTIVLVNVEDWQDLPVVRDKGLADHIPAEHQGLQDLENRGHDLRVPSVQGGLHGDNELRHDRQDLGATFLQHVIGALHRQEAIGIFLLAATVKEDGQVVVVVELVDVHLPCDLPADGAMEDLDGEIATVIKAAELGLGHRPFGRGARRWCGWHLAPWLPAEAQEGAVHSGFPAVCGSSR